MHTKEFYPHPDIPAVLSDLGSQQGVASTILFNDGTQTTRENASSYKLRLERVAYVKRHCANTPTPVLSNRKVRNSLIHIDEHLARELKRPNTGWIIDSAIARRDQFTAPHRIKIAFCRTYISEEDKLLHLDNELPLSDLRKEAADVLGAIWGDGPLA